MTKTALITGAANRIGAAMAITLAKHGYKIIVHFNTSKGAAENVCHKILAKGGKAVPVECDLSQIAQRDKLLEDAKTFFGPLDVLINTGSMTGQMLALDGAEHLEWRNSSKNSDKTK